MNLLDRQLCKLPQSTDDWHCPWFWTIFILGLNGAFFGLYAFFYYDTWLGLLAFAVGISAAGYTLSRRRRH